MEKKITVRSMTWFGLVLSLMLFSACEKKFSIKLTESQFVLHQDGLGDQKVSANEGVVQFYKDDNGNLMLVPKSIPYTVDKAEVWLADQFLPIITNSADDFELIGVSDEKGMYSYLSPNLQSPIEVFNSSCETFYFYFKDGKVMAVYPPAPVKVGLNESDITFSRDTLVKVGTKNDSHSIYLVNCPTFGGHGGVFIVEGDGLGIVILVDNIIDPDANGTGEFDGGEWQRQIQYAKLTMQGKSAEDCMNAQHLLWSDTPAMSVDMSNPDGQMEILCDRYLHIESGKGVQCIDIITCGVKLTLRNDGKTLDIFSGCPNNIGGNCPL